MSIGQELLNVPMGDMIREMAFAIAEAQVKLDASSIEVAEMMGGLKTVYDEQGKLAYDDSRVFFGYEYMNPKEAKAFLEVNQNMSKSEAETAFKEIPGASGAKDDDLIRVPTRVSMLELGFAPTFYQFVDTIIEVKIAIKITREITRGSNSRQSQTNTSRRSNMRAGLSGLGVKARSSSNSTVATSQVDASYQAKYSYSAEGSSLLRTKLSPLPPPPILEERIRALMEMENEERRRKLDKVLPPPTPPGG
jgi:hypothetical protein